MLLLDNKAAFPSVTPEQLFHDMRKRGIPEILVDWMRRKLTDRQVILCFDDYESEPQTIRGGLDQGCPSSVISYQVYNSDNLDAADPQKGEFATGNIDDVAVIAVGKTFLDTYAIFREYMLCIGGVFDWAQIYNTQFSLEKFGLLSCKRNMSGLGPALDLGTTVIQPAKSHVFLGVQIDHQLRWAEQTTRAVAKGQQWLALFKRMANSKKGIAAGISRRLYLSMAIPSMLYAGDVYLTPRLLDQQHHVKTGSVRNIQQMSSVHRQAALLITGGMHTTATDTLGIHAGRPPLRLLVEKQCYQAALRICTLPLSHPLAPLARRAKRHHVKRHCTALHEHLHAFNLDPDSLETITPTRFPPLWHPQFRTEIHADKEQAKTDDRAWRQRSKYHIYSDGSDIDGGVGAAAVLYTRGKRLLQRIHRPYTHAQKFRQTNRWSTPTTGRTSIPPTHRTRSIE